jgi:diketogulonate reductase-like aldo/keto reductase
MVAAISATRVLASGKPYLLYGTAWKKDKTAHHVTNAIRSGFRFIDTACQPKHYNEAGVGTGIMNAMKELDLSRQDIYIQTKFTSVDGQDPNNVPYDVDASLEEQVEQSLQESLLNLKTTYLDSLIMHSPMRKKEDTLRVWRVFESFVDKGQVRKLGISNCYDFDTFLYLYDNARIKPSHLQNRFYEDSGFDVKLREFCEENGILYQSFWTLTANRHALAKRRVQDMADEKGLTPQTLMYAFMMTLGHTPLDGTTNKGHMMEDVAVMERIQNGEVILDEEEMAVLGDIIGVELPSSED